jgi:molecular chaperone GrpE
MFKKNNTNNSNSSDDNDQSSDAESISEVEPIKGADKEVDDGTLDDSVVAEESAAETIKKLREKLKKTESEKQEYLTGWQLAKADFINARKRDEADRTEFIKFANEQLIYDLIPVLEHWDMALNHKESWEKADKNWRIGIESIFAQLKKALADNGLVEMDPVGEKFDHAKHEAISYEPVADEKLNHSVLAVIQKGYSLNGRILKAAKVKVGEFKK